MEVFGPWGILCSHFGLDHSNHTIGAVLEDGSDVRLPYGGHSCKHKLCGHVAASRLIFLGLFSGRLRLVVPAQGILSPPGGHHQKQTRHCNKCSLSRVHIFFLSVCVFACVALAGPYLSRLVSLSRVATCTLVCDLGKS
jgi:hypothetical protein